MKNNKYKSIFLVAMSFEVEKMFVPNGFTAVDSNSPFRLFENGDYGLVIVGVSKSLAAAGTQWAIDNFETERWVNVGLCGSLNKDFDFGDVIVVNECRFHDLDVRGVTPECKIGQVSPEMEYIFKLNTNLVPELPGGKCVSGDIFVTDKSKFEEIVNEYSPDIVEMELTAIAQVMSVNGQLDKLSGLKVISDKADSEAGGDFVNIEENLFGDIKKIVRELIK